MADSGTRHISAAASMNVASQNDNSKNKLVPREQAIELLQELISKASVRLHVAMRKQTQPSQEEEDQVGRAPKLAKPRQMQRLLDRLGSEACRELEHRLSFKLDHLDNPALTFPSSPRTPVPVQRDIPLDGITDAGSTARLPAQLADGGTLQTAANAGDASVKPCRNTRPDNAMSVPLCATSKGDTRKAAMSSTASTADLCKSHNVHPDQHMRYLGSSKRAGSPPRPACFDIYQGYRQRGASCRTNLNLQELESGIAVCWVPGGRHQGTFNKFGAVQAAAGISRKMCIGYVPQRVKSVEISSCTSVPCFATSAVPSQGRTCYVRQCFCISH